jgi:hypothetical protein
MLIRVLEIPASSGRFHFSGGEPQIFVEVDWFRDDEEMWRRDDWPEQLTDWLREKKYFNQDRAYLVLHPKRTFTINYEAP